ncbi:hypothetical protein TSIB_0111 [Thermococcus sibiricus MM 739]|uniref:Uncharacterized protein n=1 Tax=Thermococcus sibiricus (strain DSM 12597 / MM 739) TaxID=604354 RepID=C6A0N4_THESM|nr:hypothetical protein TSIB_0111 [Thermococcus sibiricus MM 739]
MKLPIRAAQNKVNATGKGSPNFWKAMVIVLANRMNNRGNKRMNRIKNGNVKGKKKYLFIFWAPQ